MTHGCAFARTRVQMQINSAVVCPFASVRHVQEISARVKQSSTTWRLREGRRQINSARRYFRPQGCSIRLRLSRPNCFGARTARADPARGYEPLRTTTCRRA
jgi:hypothetical protein